MNEDNNGVFPANSNQENTKIFDDSAFTGANNEQESLSLNTDETKAPKKHKNIFIKWQVWAIFSGVIIAAAAIIIFVMILSYEGKINDIRSIASYDAKSTELTKVSAEFDEKYEALVKDAYIIDGKIYDNTIYPSDAERTASKSKCLSRYSINADDITFSTTLKTGDELLASGSSVSEAKEHIEKIISGYTSAKDSIETCREDVLEPVIKNFEITLGELTTKENNRFSRPVTIRNNGDKGITYIKISYDLYDKNGIVIKTQTPSSFDKVQAGSEIVLDIYDMGGYWHYSQDVENEKNYRLVLRGIGGTYSYN